MNNNNNNNNDHNDNNLIENCFYILKDIYDDKFIFIEKSCGGVPAWTNDIEKAQKFKNKNEIDYFYNSIFYKRYKNIIDKSKIFKVECTYKIIDNYDFDDKKNNNEENNN